MIPYFKDLVTVTLQILKELQTEYGEGSKRAQGAAFDLINKLINELPLFWSASNLTQLFAFVINDTLGAETSNEISRNIVKKLPSEILVSSLLDTWKACNDSSKAVRGGNSHISIATLIATAT